MAREVKVGFKADTKQAEKEVNDLGEKLSLKDKVKNAVAGFADLSGALTIVTKGLETARKAYEETVGKTVAYDKTVRELSQNLMISSEEASRLIQVTDDYGVSMERASTAMEMAAKNGFAPTVENLAKLADELNAIKDPTDRAKRASEIFGRGWADINPILAEGGDKIRELAGGIQENLIRTEEQIRASRELEIALDDWNDSVSALKTEIGTGLIPAVTRLLDLFNSPNANNAADFINTVFKGTFLESPASKEARALEEQLGKTIAAMSNARDGYVGYAQALTDQQGAVENAASAQSDLASAMESFSKAALFAKASANLSEEAALQLATTMGLVDQRSMFAAQRLQEYQLMLDTGKISVETYKQLVAGLADALDRITDKHATVTIDTIIRGGGPGVPGYPGSQGGGGQNIIPYASGGSFVVPPGYPNETYPLGPGRSASSGETVTISPTFNITQQPGQSGEELARMINAQMATMTRRARKSGAQYAGGM